jgi:hypothetical protein
MIQLIMQNQRFERAFGGVGDRARVEPLNTSAARRVVASSVTIARAGWAGYPRDERNLRSNGRDFEEIFTRKRRSHRDCPGATLLQADLLPGRV